MPTDDLVQQTALALAAAALGLPILLQAARIGLAGFARLRLRWRLRAGNAAVETVCRRAADVAARADAQQAALDRLLAEQKQIGRFIASVEQSRIEMVHEIGEPAGNAVLFTCELHRMPELPNAEFGRAGGSRSVFARPVWERRNVAHIWAETPEEAMDAVHRAFDARTGIVPTRLRRAEVPS